MNSFPAPQVPGYKIGKFLGSGAGSRIYSVRNIQTGQLLVLKHVLRQEPQDERFIVQAINEHRLGRQVNHPVLRRTLEIRKKGLLNVKEVLLFMEPVSGKHLEQDQPDDLARILRIMVAVSEALAHIHQLGFVHADVNPRNILVTRKGQVKLIDYGLSCPLGTVKKRVQGTLVFLAPEQARMGQIDQRTDIFNFAAVLYWLVTGRNIGPPAVGQSLGQRAYIPSPIELNPNVGESLDELIIHCLAEKQIDRPDSMLGLAQDLRAELARLIKLPAERRFVKLSSLPARDVPRQIPLANGPYSADNNNS